MNRLEATRIVVELAGDAPIIASLGHPAYDLFAAGDRPENLYTWGSMGLASSIGLGLALARPDLRVFVLDGDGSLLMNLGSLATIRLLQPANLLLIVMDNEARGSVSRRPQADRDAAVERPGQLAERDHVAADPVSDSGADGHQHAWRRREGRRVGRRLPSRRSTASSSSTAS
ncbi:MAG: hypothetical protein AUH72_21455 [Acidobacteria bacterium 13_1_40CM_4_65_8]|nr:MAG: hypothetical protein AUH72_21455 [Acidobacteria bacterium 13_1_40CM_4_65_8]